MENLKFLEKPVLFSPRLIIGLSGWMDGGYVSTGTIVYLNNKLNAIKFAEINPHPFYIYNLQDLWRNCSISSLYENYRRISK